LGKAIESRIALDEEYNKVPVMSNEILSRATSFKNDKQLAVASHSIKQDSTHFPNIAAIHPNFGSAADYIEQAPAVKDSHDSFKETDLHKTPT